MNENKRHFLFPMLGANLHCHVMRESNRYMETQNSWLQSERFLLPSYLLTLLITRENRPGGATAPAHWPRKSQERVAAAVHAGRLPKALSNDRSRLPHC